MTTETNLNPVLAKLASWLDSKSGDKGTWQANPQRLVRWIAYIKKALSYIIAKLAEWGFISQIIQTKSSFLLTTCLGRCYGH